MENHDFGLKGYYTEFSLYRLYIIIQEYIICQH